VRGLLADAHGISDFGVAAALAKHIEDAPGTLRQSSHDFLKHPAGFPGTEFDAHAWGIVGDIVDLPAFRRLAGAMLGSIQRKLVYARVTNLLFVQRIQGIPDRPCGVSGELPFSGSNRRAAAARAF
jgi:hypothetical protein